MSGIDLDLTVPSSSGNFTTAATFTVEPSTNLSQPWVTKADGVEVNSVSVTFDDEGDGLTKELQSATFIISIPVHVQSNLEGWSFYGNGIEVITAIGNCQYNFSSEKLSPTVLEVTMSQVDSHATTFVTSPDENLNTPIKVEMSDQGKKFTVSFRYVMQYVGGTPNENGLYMSQDPKFSSRR